MYRSVPPCPTPDWSSNQWTMKQRFKEPRSPGKHHESQYIARSRVIEIGCLVNGRQSSPVRKYPVFPSRLSDGHFKLLMNVSESQSNAKSPGNRRKISPPRTRRRHIRNDQFISDVNKQQWTRPPTDAMKRLPPSPRPTNVREVSLQKRNNDNPNKLCGSPDVSQLTDHIHNPELYTDPEVDDLTSLPKPQKVVVRSLKELPWVFRYKVKRANSTLAKIMASKPTIATVDSRHSVF